MSLSELSSIPFTPAAVAAFISNGRHLDSLIQVAQSQIADLRATLRELISSHPAATKADLANMSKLKAILAELS